MDRKSGFRTVNRRSRAQKEKEDKENQEPGAHNLQPLPPAVANIRAQVGDRRGGLAVVRCQRRLELAARRRVLNKRLKLILHTTQTNHKIQIQNRLDMATSPRPRFPSRHTTKRRNAGGSGWELTALTVPPESLSTTANTSLSSLSVTERTDIRPCRRIAFRNSSKSSSPVWPKTSLSHSGFTMTNADKEMVVC